MRYLKIGIYFLLSFNLTIGEAAGFRPTVHDELLKESTNMNQVNQPTQTSSAPDSQDGYKVRFFTRSEYDSIADIEVRIDDKMVIKKEGIDTRSFTEIGVNTIRAETKFIEAKLTLRPSRPDGEPERVYSGRFQIVGPDFALPFPDVLPDKGSIPSGVEASRIFDAVELKSEMESPLKRSTPATVNELQLAESRLGFPLHPDHAAILSGMGALALTDIGMPRVDKIDTAWQQMTTLWGYSESDRPKVSAKTEAFLRSSTMILIEAGDGHNALLYHPSATPQSPTIYEFEEDTLSPQPMLKADGSPYDFRQALKYSLQEAFKEYSDVLPFHLVRFNSQGWSRAYFAFADYLPKGPGLTLGVEH